MSNQTYHYKVKAICTYNENDVSSDFSDKITVKYYLEKPVVTADDIRSDSAELVWNAVDNAESYHIYQKTNGTFTLIDTVKDTNYTATDLVLGELYDFQVEAACGKLTSEPSEIITVTPVLTDPVVSTDYTWTSAKLSWDEVDGAESYEVYQLINGNYEKVGDTTACFYEVTDLTEGTEYRFKVKAVNGITGSAFKTEVTVTPADPYEAFREKKDCYLQYGDAKIWIGQTWTDAVNASLNTQTGESGAVEYTAKRTDSDFGNTVVYCFDTIDFDNFLTVYVTDDRIAGWMTNSDNAGSFEGIQLLTNEPGAPYEKVGDENRMCLLVHSWNEPMVNDEIFAQGDSVMLGIKHHRATFSRRSSLKQEETVAEYFVNALRAAHGYPILSHNDTLYGAEDGVGTLAYAKTMAESDVCSHAAEDLTTGPLSGTSLSNRRSKLADVTNKEVVIFQENAAGEHSLGEITAWCWYQSPDHKGALLSHGENTVMYGCTEVCYMAVAAYPSANGEAYWAFQSGSAKAE